jgi:hypothetical protein
VDLRIPRTDLLTITRLIEAVIGINSQLMPHKDPLMSVSQRACQIWCKGRLKSAAGGAGWRGGRKVQHLRIKKENVARYGTMGRYTP